MNEEQTKELCFNGELPEYSVTNRCPKCKYCCHGNFCSNCGHPLKIAITKQPSKVTLSESTKQRVEVTGDCRLLESSEKEKGEEIPENIYASNIDIPREVKQILVKTKEDILGDLGVRIGDRLIYDFEKLGINCCSTGAGIHPKVKHILPVELRDKGITEDEWCSWMNELSEIQRMSPSEKGMKILYTFPGMCVQSLLCSLLCPLSVNHCLSWLPCCYGQWYDELRQWMRLVNKTLNEHGMHVKLLSYKPYTLAPKSKLYNLRVARRSRDNRYNYEMAFLVIALTADEGKRLKCEPWNHGGSDYGISGIGRCV